ncbi:hypothetical protein C1O66_09705 [Paucibacter aquatile]|uniref:Acyltransferase n=1 Tax=Kinneretia aquatilis TaxID=2070761 RepID=A0A2N8KWD4_9BURK|nr:acyltransferase [Paucibacter aquatile]PND37773.1 hypothetical protein C1O66_09705 [Paucibacter aquatile]
MKSIIKAIALRFAQAMPFLEPVVETRRTQTPISLKQLLAYRLSRKKLPYWPLHPSSMAIDAHRIHIGIETSPGLMPGCYIQGTNGVLIGDYTQVAAGVKIISANHALNDNRAHNITRPIRIGSYCWIGANAIVLPGVNLGPYTVVGAGAVVSKSFPEGFCVLAGNPAKIIRLLNPDECISHQSEYKYIGFIPADHFNSFRSKYLDSIANE